jgi:hypothetical protein
MPSFHQLQERHDNALPPDEAPEPTPLQFADAFDNLMENATLLADYIEDRNPDVITLFQILHRHGVPSYSRSQREDMLRDRMDSIIDAFVKGYREWLGVRLTNEAEMLRRKAIDDARLDAEDAEDNDSYLPF